MEAASVPAYSEPATGNAPPVAADDTYSTDEDTPLNVPAPGVLAGDHDANGDPLTIASVDTTGTVGTVSCDNAAGDCTYTPDGTFTGDDTFAYVATDGDLNSASATVTVNVQEAVLPARSMAGS